MSKEKAPIAHQEQFDVCMIFPADKDGHFKSDGLQVLRNIQYYLGEANVFPYASANKGEIYVLLRVEEAVMKTFAKTNSNKYLADKAQLTEQAKIGWAGKGIQPLKIETDLGITRYDPFEFIYLRYTTEEEFQHLYSKNNGSIFTEVERISIIYSILTGQHEYGGCQLRFGPLIKNEIILAVFSLHDRAALQELKNKFHGPTAVLVPWAQPYEAIESYFGEKITLYFKFLGHFTLYMIIPAIVGLAVELVILGFLDVRHPIAAFYSIFICIWGVCVMEFWKRTEKFVALEHGMIGYEAKETYREDFQEDKSLYLTGQEVLYFSDTKRSRRKVISYLCIAFFCIITVGTTAAIYKFKAIVSATSADLNAVASIVASIMTAIQILFYGAVYSQISSTITEYENNRTHTEHEDSSIAKNFIFKFINAYASFFFIAFFAAWLPTSTYPGEDPNSYQASFQGQCGSPSCMQTLAINLGIILATDVVVGDSLELLVPYMSEQFKLSKELQGAHPNCDLSPAEKEFAMDVYSDDELIGDYMEIAIMFGYMTMFVAALPGSTFFVLLYLIIEIKVDIWKLTHLMRRPWPRGAEDIGTWQTIFELVITAAVISNAGMIVFTMNIVSDYSTFTQLWIFIGFQWVLFTIQGLIRISIPDCPNEVQIQLQRQEFLNLKLIDCVSDVNDHMKPPLDVSSFQFITDSSPSAPSAPSDPSSGQLQGQELQGDNDVSPIQKAFISKSMKDTNNNGPSSTISEVERAMGSRQVKLDDAYINRMNSMIHGSVREIDSKML